MFDCNVSREKKKGKARREKSVLVNDCNVMATDNASPPTALHSPVAELRHTQMYTFIYFVPRIVASRTK